MLAADSPHDLAAHIWTSVVGNELADPFAEKGTLFHEVPVDVVEAVREADALVVRIWRQLHIILNSQASAKAPGACELRAPILQQLVVASPHALFRDTLKLQGQWYCFREWLLGASCVPLLPIAAPDLFPAGKPVLIGFNPLKARTSWRTDEASGGVLFAELGPLLRPKFAATYAVVLSRGCAIERVVLTRR